ncbi:MAG: CoA transferase [Deltaproteobacteria bacterium]|jgi:CoA:oxalate CoA-transferase|nr:CoA transferase [Deltaproteobacteria bacterium]
MKLLDGVTVLDLTQAYSGPFCTMHLADHGAKVIKLERPPHGDQTRGWGPFKNGASAYYALINRNKLGMTLDLNKEKGKEVFLQLAAKADVVVENFRVGTMEKLGLGYDNLKKVNPRLIYASISGFGLEGPLSGRPAYDIVAQGMSGIMSITGFADKGPTKVGPSLGDSYTGSYLTMGIAMALFNRERSGQGHRLDVAMLDTLFHNLENAVVTYTVEGVIPEQMGNTDPAIAPFDTFEAKDGVFVMGVGTDKMWGEVCAAMGRPDLAEDPRYRTNADRCKNYLPDLRRTLLEWTNSKTVAQMEEILVSAGIPFGPVLNVAQTTEHPQIAARNMIQEVDDPLLGKVRLCGIPIKARGVSDKIERPAPRLGEHNEEVLRDLLGYDAAAVRALKEAGAVF